jgi:peptidoglycan hydrolase-like protein with peptidoglycan-binding domain
MEALSAIPATVPAPEVKAPEVKTPAPAAQPVLPAPTQVAKLESLPPAGPYKPSAIEIQTALKNAGYYTSVVDGKFGPMSKKAVAEFQKANGLEADGKVGPKTWAVLGKYLNPAPPAPAAPGKKR